MTISIKKVTPSQIKFLRLLHDSGPLTARELASGIEKSIQYIHEIICSLREGGIIEKTFEGIDMNTKGRLSWKYKLSVPIDSLSIKTRQTSQPSRRISDEEILYVAILRNAEMTGQELRTQFNSVYPNRSRGSIMNIITKARQKRWCR